MVVVHVVSLSSFLGVVVLSETPTEGPLPSLIVSSLLLSLSVLVKGLSLLSAYASSASVVVLLVCLLCVCVVCLLSFPCVVLLS